MLERYFLDIGTSILSGVTFFIFAGLFALWLGKFLHDTVLRKTKVDPSLAAIMAQTVRISIIVLSGIAVLQELGVEIASLIAALGVFGFAIALGLRTSLANFFTGMVMYIVKPYEVGDHVEGERVDGVVEKINAYHTVVATSDGVYVSIPNGVMWARSIRNLSRPRPWRVDLDVTVTRQLPYPDLRAIVEGVAGGEAKTLKTIAPRVGLRRVLEKTYVLRLSAWCKAEDSWDLRQSLTARLRSEIAERGGEVKKIAAVSGTSAKRRPAERDPARDRDPDPQERLSPAGGGSEF